ncbi:MAG: NERD domain-containing protein [Bacillota bacterium]|nr:NERD domain-containing protein [Bacillota bacterium]
MGLFDLIGKAIFGSKKMESINGPTFIKEFSKENQQLKDLEQILGTLNDAEKKERISRDIAYLKQGMIGEQNVNFELQNANVPLLCLHDIRLEYEGLSAQIDFILLTKQYICILETKQLQGNIDIYKDGSFIRVFKNKLGNETKTGMYSPVEQNRKHLNLVKKILKEKFNINNMPVKSLIVLANPKTILRKAYAPKEIQEQIIRAENLASTLIDWINEIDYTLQENIVFQVAEYFKNNHKPITYDYLAKYRLLETEAITELAADKEELTAETVSEEKQLDKTPNENVICKDVKYESSEEDYLREQLKKFRLETSRKENIKPYLIFNNIEMEGLIEKRPKVKEELLQVKGFGEKKVDKYGTEILKIFETNNK